MPVFKPVRRKPINRTAGFVSFASIDLPSLFDARTFRLDATLYSRVDPSAVPSQDHNAKGGYEADSEPVAGECSRSAGDEGG